MGNILWCKKRPPSEELDELVVQIRELEAQLKQLLADRAGILRWLNCFTVLIAGVLSALGWLQHGTVRKRLLCVAIVLLCALLGLFMVRYLITLAFGWFINRKRNRINFFTEQKLAIIENVKENEKYNVAMELIKKYGEEGALEKKNGTSARVAKNGSARRRGSKDDDLGGVGGEQQLQREQQINITPNGRPSKMLPKLYEMQDNTATFIGRSTAMAMGTTAATPYYQHYQRTPIRPFIEQSRTPVDRVLDFLMGESINSRFALICSNCHTHNGMAVQEEFESLSFFCFKCNTFNPSKNELKLRHQQQEQQFQLASPPSTSCLRRPSTVSLQSEDEQQQQDVNSDDSSVSKTGQEKE